MHAQYQVKYVTRKTTRNDKPMQILTLAKISEDGEILKPIRAFQFGKLTEFNRTRVYSLNLSKSSRGQYVIPEQDKMVF